MLNETLRIRYHHSAMDGFGQVVAISESEQELEDRMARTNAKVKAKYAGWMVEAKKVKHPYQRAQYEDNAVRREEEDTLVRGPYLEEGVVYQRRGIFVSAPLEVVHGKADHSLGSIKMTKDSKLSDGTHV